MVEDVGDEKQVKLKKAEFLVNREKELLELGDLLQSYLFRAFIWRLLAKSQITTFGYCGDNNFLNNLEGQRTIGSWVQEEVLEANPEAFLMMRNEAVSRDTKKKGK